MHAEQAYLFRHALLRDAAYELQAPGDRARLHAVAVEISQILFARDASRLRVLAAEMAAHAQLAAAVPEAFNRRERASLAKAECGLRREAALHAESLGEGANALAHLGRLVELETKPGKKAWALESASRVCELLGRYAQGLEHASAAAKLSRHAGDRASLHRCLTLTGILETALARPAAAAAALRSALRMARADGNVDGQCACLGNLALAMLQQRDEATAEKLLLQGLKLSRQHKHTRNEGRFLLVLADIRKTDLGMIEQALALCRAAGDRRGESAVLTNLGGYFWKKRRYAECKRLYQQALEIALRLGDRRMAGVALGNVAAANSKLGNLAGATAQYRQALEIALELGDRPHIGMWKAALTRMAKRKTG